MHLGFSMKNVIFAQLCLPVFHDGLQIHSSVNVRAANVIMQGAMHYLYAHFSGTRAPDIHQIYYQWKDNVEWPIQGP